MNWEDEGYIVNKTRFRENALILEVFTKNFGKVSGIVYGGTSRKIKNHLQLINKIHVIFNSKTNNKIGYFKTELVKPISPMYFNDKKRTSALTSLCSILNVLLPEGQPNKIVYRSFEEFLSSINLKNWIFLYIFFELNLIKDLGFDPNLQKFKDDNLSTSFRKIKIDNFSYEVPSFLIFKKIPDNSSNQLIKKSLYFTRNIIQNRFFTPNNLPFPKSRVLLENYFN